MNQQDAVRFVVGRRDLQRCSAVTASSKRLLQVDRRQLGDDVGRLRIELDRALEAAIAP